MRPLAFLKRLFRRREMTPETLAARAEAYRVLHAAETEASAPDGVRGYLQHH
jgi:hypothetical protein